MILLFLAITETVRFLDCSIQNFAFFLLECPLMVSCDCTWLVLMHWCYPGMAENADRDFKNWYIIAKKKKSSSQVFLLLKTQYTWTEK